VSRSGRSFRKFYSTFHSTLRVVISLLVVIVTAATFASPAVAIGSRSAHAAKELILTRPDAVSAATTARAEHHRVEILDKLSSTTTTYANPNGTFTTDSSSAPVRTRDASGKWVDISTTLSLDNGNVSLVGANPADPTFAFTSGNSNAALATVDSNGQPFSMTPLGQVGNTPQVSGGPHSQVVASPFATPLVHRVAKVNARIASDVSPSTLLRSPTSTSANGSGNEIVYPHAIGASSLVYALGPGALSESIEVPNAKAAGSGEWRYVIHAPGYRVREIKGGSFTFTSKLGGTPIEIPQGIALDSSKAQASAEVHLAIHSTSTPGTWLLDESVSRTWLRSSARVWPINVDPTIDVVRQPGINYRSNGTQAAVSYGSGAFIGNPNSGSANYWRSIIDFSTAGFQNTHIDWSNIVLGVNNGTTTCYNASAHVPTAPSYAGAKAGATLTSASVCSAGTMPDGTAIDNYLQSNDANTGISLGFVGYEVTSAATYKGVYPQLYVTYDTPPTTPNAVGVSDLDWPFACSYLVTPVGGVNYVNNPSPRFCLNSYDPDSGALLTFYISIYTAAGAPVESFWTTNSQSSGAVGSGVNAYGQAPTPLADGTYYWTSIAYNGISYSALSSSNQYFDVYTARPTMGAACTSTSPAITTSGETIDASQDPSGISLSCTFTANSTEDNIATYSYQLDNGTEQYVTATGSASNNWSTTVTIPIPSASGGGAGLQSLYVGALDLAQNPSVSSLWTLDVGYGMSQPFANADATATIPISAMAPSGTVGSTTAEVCWIPTNDLPAPGTPGSCTGSWTNVTSDVTEAWNGAAWSGNVVAPPTGMTGVVTPTPATGPGTGYTNPYTAPSLSLNVAAAGISAPQAIDVEVCFTTSGTTTCAPPQPVQVVANGIGDAMANTSVGPGQLSLTSGNYALSATDASLTGLYDTTQVTRTYETLPSSGADYSELGPGWTYNEIPSGGYGDYSVTDGTLGESSAFVGNYVSISSPLGDEYDFQDGYTNHTFDSTVTSPQLVAGNVVTNLYATGPAAQQDIQATMQQNVSTVNGQLQCQLTLTVTNASLVKTTWQTATQAAPSGPFYCDQASASGYKFISIVEPSSQGSANPSVNTWTYVNGQPSELIANMGPSLTCPTTAVALPVTAMTLPEGCRMLSFQYATSTTATATARTGTTGYGSYKNPTSGLGQLTEIDQSQWDPNASGGAALVTLPVQCYLYDAGGYLRETWDPRVGVADGTTPTCSSSPVLPTLYSYSATAPDSSLPNNYPMTTLTPSSTPNVGANFYGWTFAYDSSDRLASATQNLDSSDSSGSTSATTTIDYGVPIAGDGATPGNGAAGLPVLNDPSAWNQTVDVPVTGVAIFPPDHVPSATPTASDFTHAAISYLDGYGRLVDTASYGDGAYWNNGTTSGVGSWWNIAAQQYGQQLGSTTSNFVNSQENVVWSLSANGFEVAAAAGSSSATVAQQEASLNFYNTSTLNEVPIGAELTDSYGPLHSVTTSGGSVVSARTHTNEQYGLDSPATYGTYTNGGSFTLNTYGLPWQLVTQTALGYSTTSDPSSLSTSAMAADFASTSLPDYRTTQDYYYPLQAGDGSPLSFETPSKVVTTVAGSTTITRATRLNSVGQTIEVDQPLSAGSGSDQGSTQTTYYTTGSGSCANSVWVGLPCQSGPNAGAAHNAAVGSANPITTTTYDWGLLPQVQTETVSGTTEKTTTSTHDESGRVTATRVVDNVTGDTAVPDTYYYYSPTTGLHTATESVTGDTISGDTLTSSGTPTSSSTTTYDADARVQSTTDATSATSSFTYNVDSQVLQETEPVAHVTGGISICSTYGGTDAKGNTEDRPVVTSESIVTGTSCAGSSPATFTAAYDANGNQTTLVYPNGMVATTSYDLANEPTALAYTQGGAGVTSGYGTAVMSMAQGYNAFGQVATASTPESSNTFSYDGVGRLTGVGDNFEGTCYTRNYTLDADSNRTAYQATTSSPSGGSCPTTPTGTTTSSTSSTFDTNGSGQYGSDRAVSSTWNGTASGTYAYDVLGRVTTLPSVDTGTGGSTSAGNVYSTYMANDQVASMCQGSSSTCTGEPTETFTYDPTGNVLTTTTANASGGLANGTSTNHYDGGSTPAWIDNANSTSTAFVDGISLGNALNVTFGATASPNCLGDTTASCTLNLFDLRGDVIATAAITNGTGAVSTYSEQTEFGLPQPSGSFQTTAAPYGWLGAHQKNEANLSGLVLMGARVYDPTSGRFLSIDPILGGNAGPYLYPADPVNQFDLSGQSGAPGRSSDVTYPPTKAELRTEKYCMAHPSALGRNCGGLWHEIWGTLYKGGQHLQSYMSGEIPREFSRMKCIYNAVLGGGAAMGQKDSIARGVNFISHKHDVYLLEDNEIGWTFVAVSAGYSCFSGGPSDIP